MNTRDQPAPKQLKKFLSNGKNKIDLVHFLLNDWSHHENHKQLIKSKELYVTVEESAFCITIRDNELHCSPSIELSSVQEEADTKMFLAANHAAYLGQTKATIITVDSDVAILACYFAPRIELELYVQIGTGSNVRVLDPASLDVNHETKLALPALHAISGCDSVSAFHGIGKAKWVKLMDKEEHRLALALLGEDIDVPENVSKAIEVIVCELYGTTESCINEARFKIFCRKSMPDPSMLPPTKGELQLHIERANYQTLVWKKALERNPNIPPPDDHGWEMENSFLKVVWMTDKPAPEAILELCICYCKRRCDDRCQCKQNRLRCTEVCACEKSCHRDESDSESEESEDEDDETDDESHNSAEGDSDDHDS